MNFQISKSSIMSATLDHAHYMIQVLPRWVNANIEPELQFAALEDWLTNIRLVSEFYRISGKGNPNDFSVDDFLTDFKIKDEYVAELNELWVLASRHVSHLSRERLSAADKAVTPFDDSLKNLTRISQFISEIYEEFKKQISTLGTIESNQATTE